MEPNETHWINLSLPFDQNCQDALQQQHYAAQFVALAGKHLTPQSTDDSNTNMQYISDQDTRVGNELSNGSRLGFRLRELELLLLNEVLEETDRIRLVGQTQSQVFEKLLRLLDESGVDIANLSHDLHYEIPHHPIAEGAAFEIRNPVYFKETAFYRHNAEVVLDSAVSEFDRAAPIRVWPHHFDTGTSIPLDYKSDGSVSKSIGLGWAIPDSLVDEPYFYLSFWSENSRDNQELPALEAGQWMMPNWNGAVLRHSESLHLSPGTSQAQLVRSFFESGLSILSRTLVSPV